LFGSDTAPASSSPPSNDGFIKDFAYTLGWQAREGWSILPGTTAQEHHGLLHPEALPVLSGLAKGYAVCDHWFSSAPTETMPNRGLRLLGNQPGAHGRQDAHVHLAVHLRAARRARDLVGIYGYDAPPLTKATFTDISGARRAISGCSPTSPRRPRRDAARVSSWSQLEFHRQQPAPELRRGPGEQLIHDVYEALRGGPAVRRRRL